MNALIVPVQTTLRVLIGLPPSSVSVLKDSLELAVQRVSLMHMPPGDSHRYIPHLASSTIPNDVATSLKSYVMHSHKRGNK